METLTGRIIRHYQLGERLGTGGMGEVYKAEDTRLRRTVAVKLLPTSHRLDADRRARFLQEARAASAVQSPNIVATYELGEHEGTAFLVMEYVEGQLLSEKLKDGPLPVSAAIDYAMQVASALQEAHANGIIHRDIKSENLIVAARGVVKMIDFGLAKLVEDPRSHEHQTMTMPPATQAGMVLGTGPYMSPEQALGHHVDVRSDIFSLGVVIYQMLTGRLPFEGSTVTEVIDHIVHHEPPAIARFNYDVPPALEAVVRKALEKDPEFRFQTARDLYIDLANVKKTLESPGADAGPPEGPRALPLQNAVAVMPFQNVTRNPDDDWIGLGIAETVMSDLKGLDGLQVIGRERLLEEAKNARALEGGDEGFAIDLARRLGVSWMVTGGYQRLQETLRITARFLAVDTGAVLRTVKIDGRVDALFALQDRIVGELTTDLELSPAAELGPGGK